MAADVGLGIAVGAILGSSVGHTFSAFDKKIAHTQSITKKITIGKALAKDVTRLQKKITTVGAAMKTLKTPGLIKEYEQLNRELSQTNRKARLFGINTKNSERMAKSLGRAISRNTKKMKIFQNMARRKADRQQLKGDIMKNAAMGAAVAIPLKMAIGSAVNFKSAMGEVSTLVDTSKVDMDALGTTVRKVGKDFGTGGTAMAGATYQAISAGVAAADIGDFMKVAGKAAIGGSTDVTTAVDGITSVVNAYGKDVVSATQASDFMFTAVRLGKTNFSELSKSLYNVIPGASALNVGFGEVTASISTLTALGTPTSVATTQMRSVFDELSKSSSKVYKTFERLTGKSFKEFVASGGNLQQALQIIKREADTTNKGMKDFFGSTEAGSAALTLTGKGASKFSSDLKEMNSATGASEEAFAKMSKTAKFQFSQLKAKLGDIGITIGSALLPAVLDLADKFSNVASKVGSFIEKNQKLAKVIIGMVVGFVTLKGAFSVFKYGKSVASDAYDGITLLKDGFANLTSAAGRARIKIVAVNVAQKAMAIGSAIYSGAMKIMSIATGVATTSVGALGVALLTNPITWIVGGIALSALLIWKYWEPISSFFKGIWDGIMVGLSPLIGSIKSAFFSLLDSAMPVINWLGKTLAPVAKFFSPVIDAIKSVWNWFTELLTPVTGVADGAHSMGETVGLVIGNLVSTVGSGIGTIIGILWDFNPAVLIVKAFKGVFNFLSNIDWSQSGSKIIGTLISGITSKATALVGKVKGVFSKVRNLLPFSDAKEGPLSQLTLSGSKIMTTLGEGVNKGAGKLKNTVGSALKDVGLKAEVKAGQTNNPEVSQDSKILPSALSQSSRSANVVVSKLIENLHITVQQSDNTETDIADKIVMTLESVIPDLVQKIKRAIEDGVNSNQERDFSDAYESW